MQNLVVYIFLDQNMYVIDLVKISKQISSEYITFGSDPHMDFSIDHPALSERHLCFYLQDGFWHVDDISMTGLLLPSKNRTGSLMLKNGIAFASGHKSEALCFVYEKSITEDLKSDYSLGKISEISIGNKGDENIQILQKGLPLFQIRIAMEDAGKYTVRALEGHFVYIDNKKAMLHQVFEENATLQILGIRMSFWGKNFSINRTEDIVKLNNLQALSDENHDPYIRVRRVPREMRPLPKGEMTILEPDRSPEMENENDIISLLSPLIYAGGMILLFMFMRSGSSVGYANPMFFIGFSVISVFTAIIIYFVTKKRNQKRHALRETKRVTEYKQYLKDLENYLHEKHEEQRLALLEHHPSPLVCLNFLKEKSFKLWSKLPTHYDFLEARIGVGKERFSMQLIGNDNPIKIKNNALMQEAFQLKEKFNYLEEVPIVIRLKEHFAVGFCGEAEQLYENIFGLIVNLSFHHAYTEVRFVFLLTEDARQSWSWVRLLPHVWDERKNMRFIVSDPLQDAHILTELTQILQRREENKGTKEAALPHYMIFVQNQALLEQTKLSRYLYAYSDPTLGFSTIFIDERFELLPPNCQIVVKVNPLVSEYFETDSPASKRFFKSDTLKEDLSSAFNNASSFGYNMAPLRVVALDAKASLPELITFLDVYDIKLVEDLKILSRWSENKSYQGLSVPIGMGEANKILMLDISEKGHGPHGLIAGTTGSGKSEFIQSLILSLSVNFSPQDLAFLFVDFKGGATARAFEDMPHNLGILTNIEEDTLYQINRAMVSLKKEVEERQMLLQKPYENIDAYQRAFYHGEVERYVPHLVIVVDEFAELKNEFPDFIDQLISISRIGRSLGIHLILATQKPAGVVNNQIWSNSKFRICLKVQDREDSNDVIKKPDAAEIKKTGQGYLQVGNNEVFELFQSTYSGAKYNFEYTQTEQNEIFEIQLNGKISPSMTVHQEEMKKTNITQLAAIVKSICNLTYSNFEPNKIWQDALKKEYFLDEILHFTESFHPKQWFLPSANLSPVIGIADDIYAKTQPPLCLDLHHGHTLVYGSPSCGKTNFVYTLATSLLKHYGPAALNLYLIDFSSQNMITFQQAPQVGGIVSSGEIDKLQQLLKILKDELNKRKKLLAEIQCLNWEQYKQYVSKNEEVSTLRLPNIVILIDNYPKLKELVPDIEETLSSIMSESTGYGIYFVMNAGLANGMSYRMLQNFSIKVALTLSDKSLYREIFGKQLPLIPAAYPGRALVRIKDNKVLECQTAIYASGLLDTDRVNTLRKDFDTMCQATPIRAREIPLVPDIVTEAFVFKNIRASQNAKVLMLPHRIPFAVDCDTVEPVALDLRNLHGFLLSGKPKSGKTNFLHQVLRHFVRQYHPNELEIHLIDNEKGSLASYKNQAILASYLNHNEENIFVTLLDALSQPLKAADKKIRILIMDDFLDFFQRNIKASEQTDVHNKLTHLLKYPDKYNFKFFCTANLSEISANMSAASTRTLLENQHGLILGGSINEHRFSVDGLSHSERSKVLKKWEAYLISRDEAKKIKIAIETM